MNQSSSVIKPLVVITGASSGIGEATALHLSRLGTYRLLLAGRNEARLSKVVDACREMQCVEVISCIGDLRHISHIRDILTICESHLPIAALVNSAGIGKFLHSVDFSDEDWQSIIDTNLTATFRLCRDIGALMAKQATPSTIVNISSDADSTAFPEAAAYCASKAGLLGMTRALRLDFRPHGIRICIVSPGRVDTRFNSKEPGMRPGSLSAGDVAEVVAFAISCSPNIELQEIRLDSMLRTSG